MRTALSSRSLGLLFILSFGLRGLAIALTRDNPLFDLPILLEESFAPGGWLSDWCRQHAGDRGLSVTHALFDSMAVLVIARAASARSGAIAGWAAGVFGIAAWPLILFGLDGTLSSFAFAAGALVLAAWDRAESSTGRFSWVLVGGALGLATLVRVDFLLVALAALLFTPRPDALRRRIGVAIGMAGVLGTGWATGAWNGTAPRAGWALWAGNHAESQGTNLRFEAFGWLHEDDRSGAARRGLALDATPSETNAFWRDEAIATWRSDTGAAWTRVGHRVWAFAQGWERSERRDLTTLREASRILAGPWPSFGWVFPCAIVGLLSRAKNRSRAFWRGWLLAGGIASAFTVVNSSSRLLVWPPLLLLAGVGLAGVFDLDTPRRTRLIRFGILVVVAFVVNGLGPRARPDSVPALDEWARVDASYNANAERNLREELLAFPERGAARFHLGLLLMQQGRREESLRELTQVAHAFPLSLHARRTHAEALEIAGRFPDALEARREAARLSGNAPEEVLAYANALGRAGRHEEAMKSYDRLRQTEFAEEPFFLLNAGQTALFLKRLDGLDDLHRATKFEETREDAYVALATHELSHRRTEDALRVLSEAILHVSASVQLHSLRALARYASGDPTGAAEDLELVIALNPNDAAARSRLADIRAGREPSR